MKREASDRTLEEQYDGHMISPSSRARDQAYVLRIETPRFDLSENNLSHPFEFTRVKSDLLLTVSTRGASYRHPNHR